MFRQVSDIRMIVWQAWPSTRLSLDKKQGYGMTNPDSKCPVMRRRPLAVTFGSQRSARGGQNALQVHMQCVNNFQKP